MLKRVNSNTGLIAGDSKVMREAERKQGYIELQKGIMVEKTVVSFAVEAERERMEKAEKKAG